MKSPKAAPPAPVWQTQIAGEPVTSQAVAALAALLLARVERRHAAKANGGPRR